LCQLGFINLCPVEELQDFVGVTLSHSHGHFFLLELRHSAPSVGGLIISNRLMGIKLIRGRLLGVLSIFFLVPVLQSQSEAGSLWQCLRSGIVMFILSSSLLGGSCKSRFWLSQFLTRDWTRMCCSPLPYGEPK
jgi:hypothetical protein